MNLALLTTSPVWTEAGWTMLHLLWDVVGFVAASARSLLKPVCPGVRYCIAVGCLLVLAISPGRCILSGLRAEFAGRYVDDSAVELRTGERERLRKF